MKVSTSFLKNGTVDTIMVGGVVANAFLWAKGINIGRKNKDFIIKNNRNHAEIIAACKTILQIFSCSLREIPTLASDHPINSL